MIKKHNNAVNPKGGRTAAEIFGLSGLSKKELLDRWYATAEKLGDTNPFDNYYEWRALNAYFNAIVEAYYADWDGIIKLEEDHRDE